MRRIATLSLVSLIFSCHSRAQPAADPGSPTPVTAPSAGATPSPQLAPGEGVGGEPRGAPFPARAAEAPLVRVQETLEVDSLLGRRVRVRGHCTAVGAGVRAGSWTLEDEGAAIEVRGLVPRSCTTDSSRDLTIFAQVEPTRSGSRERLLLRLPD
jgi:hypothetical protein